MEIRTLLKYLVGDREAILTIAGNRRAAVVGLLFVLAAGLAREYDTAYLVAEPWRLLVPVGASVGLSFVLFGLLSLGIKRTDAWPGYWRAYGSFLTLFWMTAPLALLYAVPYERFLLPREAAAANLWTLGVVVGWRVLLMTRVVSVLMGASGTHAFCVVMLFADAVALPVLLTTAAGVLNFMGGVRLSDRDEMVMGPAMMAFVVGFYSGIVWLGAGLTALFKRNMTWQAPIQRLQSATSVPLRVVAIAVVLVWVPLLPTTQGEQRLRWLVEQHLMAGRLGPALEIVAAHSQREFPPQWDPPPHPPMDGGPELLDVMDAIAARGAPSWFRAGYVEKLERLYLLYRGWSTEDDAQGTWQRLDRILAGLPEGPELRRRHAEFLEALPELIAERSARTRPTTERTP